MTDRIRIEGTIDEFLQEHQLSVKNRIIYLGWENEWTDKNRAIRNALFEYAVKNTYSIIGPPDWQRSTFKINKNGEEYIVQYDLDSRK